MKAVFFNLAMAALLLVLQTAFLPSAVGAVSRLPGLGFFEGHTIDLALIALVYLAFHRDFLGAFLWAALFGILAGSFGPAWRGATAVGYFAVVVLAAFTRRQVLLETKLSIVGVVAAFTLAHGLVHLGAGHLFGRVPDPFASQWGTLATQTFLNGSAAPLLYGFLFFFDGVTGGRSARERRALLLDA